MTETMHYHIWVETQVRCDTVCRCSAVQTMVAESPLTSVSLMHDGATLAVGSIRGKVYVYDLRKGSTPFKVITAHKSSVKSMCFEAAKSKTSRVRESFVDNFKVVA